MTCHVSCCLFKMADEVSIEQKGKLILESRKNSNLLIDILDLLGSAVVDEVSRSISCLEGLFEVFISKRLWNENGEDRLSGLPEQVRDRNDQLGQDCQDKTLISDVDAETVYSKWLHDKYLVFIKSLLHLLTHEGKVIQKRSLCCLMQMVLAESEAASKGEVDARKPQFANTLFSKIVNTVLLSDFSKRGLVDSFQEYLVYEDIQYFTLKTIKSLINNKLKRLGNKGKLISSICNLLLKITSQRETENDSEIKLFVKNEPDVSERFSWESKEKKKVFSDTWLSLLQLDVPHECLRKVLGNLHESVMPYMEDPRMLLDFLTDVYDMEGPVALLALNGLFILIQQYNLDYPEFFKKLYQLVNARVFELKYRRRFFILTDLFLTSTNLPAYMAAAFIKRLARISLQAPPDGIKIALALIENLLKRHPSCRVLIHRKHQTESDDMKLEYETDPYDYDEEDPAKCKALNSSLWELKSLEQHYHPEVQEAVKVFQKPFNKEENEISDFVNDDYSNLFNNELVAFQEEENIPFAFKPVDKLFENVSSNGIWYLE